MTLRAGAFVFAALLSATAAAAELGDVSVRSYIGQQLAADIELVSLTPEDSNGLQVRLAQPNVYLGANITMNPALTGVHMTVVKREQRQFLHITTLQPVETDYLHLFLELNTGSRHEVRAATLWLQPDPHPAPPPAPMPVAVTAPAAQSASVPPAMPAGPSEAALAAARARAHRMAPVAKAVMPDAAPAPIAEALPKTAAPKVPHDEPVAGPAAATRKSVAPKELAAAIAAKLPAPAPAAKVAAKPEAPAHASASASIAASAPASAAAEGTPVAAVVSSATAKAPPLKGTAPPAACAPSAGITAKECAALDSHSIALSTKLVELEGKLKVLQRAVESKNAAATAHAAGEGGAVKAAANATHAASAPGKPATAGQASASGKSASASASASAAAPAAAKLSASTTSAAAKALAAADAALGLPPSKASASASASVPAKHVKVLPKLKYKKEKPAEQGMKTSTLVAIGAGALALAGGLGWWLMRRRKAQGSAPLKIWQGWRKKKTPDATPEPAQPLHEVTPESLLEP